jgi:cupin 2 domain-containing protein
MDNIFTNLPTNFSEEHFLELFSNEHTKIKRIVSPKGCVFSDQWYDQDETEWVIIVQGEAVLEFEDHEIEMRKGDHQLISANQKHRVKSVSSSEDTIWLAVYFR